MITLRIDTRSLERGVKKLAGVPAKIVRVQVQAAPEAGDKVRTDIRRGLKDVTGVRRYGDITERVYSRTPTAGRYVIIARGPGLPITAFRVRRAGGAVEADPWGVGRVFKRSFFLPSGPGRARLTIHRKPIRRLFGPNLAKELLKANMADRFYASVRRNLLPIVEKRLARALT